MPTITFNGGTYGYWIEDNGGRVYSLTANDSTDIFYNGEELFSSTLIDSNKLKINNIPVPLSSNNSVSFAGWDPSFTSGTTFSNNTTFTATWRSNSSSMSIQLYDKDGTTYLGTHTDIFTEYTPGITCPSFTKTNGITINEWLDEDGNRYYVGDYIDAGSRVTKLIAADYEEYIYQISFNTNGGTGGPDPIVYETGLDAGIISITIPSEIPVYDGYTFVGWWYIDVNGNTQLAQPGEIIQLYPGDYVFDAYWEENNTNPDVNYITYIITFNANGGNLGNINQVYVGKIDLNETTSFNYTLPTETPTRDGYTFIDWCRYNDDGSESHYNAGSIYTCDGNVTLYATWNKQNQDPSTNTCTIKYYVNNILYHIAEEIITENLEDVGGPTSYRYNIHVSIPDIDLPYPLLEIYSWECLYYNESYGCICANDIPESGFRFDALLLPKISENIPCTLSINNGIWADGTIGDITVNIGKHSVRYLVMGEQDAVFKTSSDCNWLFYIQLPDNKIGSSILSFTDQYGNNYGLSNEIIDIDYSNWEDIYADVIKIDPFTFTSLPITFTCDIVPSINYIFSPIDAYGNGCWENSYSYSVTDPRNISPTFISNGYYVFNMIDYYMKLSVYDSQTPTYLACNGVNYTIDYTNNQLLIPIESAPIDGSTFNAIYDYHILNIRYDNITDSDFTRNQNIRYFCNNSYEFNALDSITSQIPIDSSGRTFLYWQYEVLDPYNNISIDTIGPGEYLPRRNHNNRLYTNILYAVWSELNVNNISVKVEGEMKTGSSYIKIGGSWKKGVKNFIKINGEWRTK